MLRIMTQEENLNFARSIIWPFARLRRRTCTEEEKQANEHAQKYETIVSRDSSSHNFGIRTSYSINKYLRNIEETYNNYGNIKKNKGN